MGYEFYYDKLRESAYHTYRLVGSPSRSVTSSGELGSRGSVSVILRGFITDAIRVDIEHKYDWRYSTLASVYSRVVEAQSKGYQAAEDVLNEIRAIFKGNEEYIDNKYSGIQVLSSNDYAKGFAGTAITIPITFSSTLINQKVDNSWKSAKEQLDTLMDYSIGKSNKKNNVLKYSAPHGYAPDTGEGFNPEGTLSLYYGRSAYIENLLLQNLSFTYSKELDESGDPLYIQISFNLIPAITFTKEDIDGILLSSTSITSQGSSKGWS